VALELITIAWALAFAVALRWQRALDARAWRVWDEIVQGVDGVVQGLRESLQRRRKLITLTATVAADEQADGNHEQAQRLLRVSRDGLVGLAVDILMWLEEWSDAARVAAAVAPASRPRVGMVSGSRLRVVALVWRVLDAWTLTRRERLLLRNLALSHAVRVVVRFWKAARLPAARSAKAWPEVAILDGDLSWVCDESVEAYHAHLRSRQASARAISARLEA
jgi:hypothetical protein